MKAIISHTGMRRVTSEISPVASKEIDVLFKKSNAKWNFHFQIAWLIPTLGSHQISSTIRTPRPILSDQLGALHPGLSDPGRCEELIGTG